MIVLGIDPGINGGFAVYDSAERELRWAQAIPTHETSEGKCVDVARFWEDIRDSASWAKMVFVEKVNGRLPRGPGGKVFGSAGPALFNFGYAVGQIHMTLANFGFSPVLLEPQEWQAGLRVPVGKRGSVICADRLFPVKKQLWRGPKGGLHHDIAEAALIAKYGAESRWAEEYQRQQRELRPTTPAATGSS